MIVPLQVQHSVNDEVRTMSVQGLALVPRLASEHWRAQHDVASRNAIVHERQHIGCGVLSAVRLVQGSSFRGSDETHRYACIAVKCGSRPSPKQGACRKIVARSRVLDAERKAPPTHAPVCATSCVHVVATARASLSSCVKSGMTTASGKASRLSPT